MPLPADLQSSGAVAEKCREPQGRGTEDLTQRVARFRQVNMETRISIMMRWSFRRARS
jgi:hypothetical protein